jgi:hypothetical protein
MNAEIQENRENTQEAGQSEGAGAGHTEIDSNHNTNIIYKS